METKMIKVGNMNNLDVMFKMVKIDDLYRFDFVYDNKNYINSDSLYDMVADGYNDLCAEDKLDILEYHDSRPSDIIDEIIADNVSEDIITYIESWLDDNDICYDEILECEDSEEYYYTDSENCESLEIADILNMERCMSNYLFLDMVSLYHMVYVHSMVNTENITINTIQEKIEKLWKIL